MAVKRTEDPLHLVADNIQIEPKPGDECIDLAAMVEIINRSTLGSRIDFLRRHQQLIAYADDVQARAMAKGYGTRDLEDDWELRALVSEGECAALYFDAEYLPARVLKDNARKGLAAMQANNPSVRLKQEAKAGAHALWLERHRGKHKNLRTVEQFAIEVMRRWPVLTSSQVIRKWSAQWSKDNR